MNSLNFGSTIEIPQLIITELNKLNKEVVVHSIVTKTNSSAQNLYSQLNPNHNIQLNGLTFMKTEQFVIFVVSIEECQKQITTILLFLYVVSQYMHFVENEQDSILKLFDQLPIQSIQKQAPKVSKQYQSLLKHFNMSKKHCKLSGKPKMIVRFKMTGIILLNLMLDFCEYVNSNRKINGNLFVGVFNRECYRQYEDVRNKYYQQVVKIQSDQRIQDMATLFHNLVDIQQDVLLKLLDSSACSEMKLTFVEFLSYCKDNQKKIMEDNSTESEKYCNALLQSYLNLFITECQNVEEVIQQKDIFIKQKWASFEEILDGYLKDAQGPNKHMINEQITNIIFQECDKWFESLNSHYMFELNKSKAQLMQTVENYQELQNRLAEVESKKFELEDMNQGLMFELESQKRETEKITRLKELAEELCQNQSQELKLKLSKSKDKNKKYKEQLEKIQEDNRRISYELNEKKKEQINILVKVQNLEKALDQTIQKQEQDKFEKELISLIQLFKERLEIASRDSISSNSRASTDQSSFRVLEKLQQKYDKAKEKCRQLEDELQKTKHLNETLQKKNQDNEFQIEQMKNELSTRLSKEEGDKLVKEQKQRDDDLYSVLKSHKATIEKMNEQHSQLQQQFYEKSIQFSNLEFQRGNTLTILREALKFQMKIKNNTLVSILKSMPPEQSQEIKEILHSVGLKL
ncbi:unnamed protein product (macronuclear) [Paramecium tetraurelia]|uniref:GRIP domain-containing protein n=1 Tax=Paramecium tetraurelia TaxID=5888 RepID=A0BG90_PARTE|nr:uncharacterized protein GSPATT00028592001 [Paramecium tetraurelia]CAK57557.1 unnamed protein product [Paramecium tetraurelia]|eukprot:XP_001424955.1 hypothetical protein (macronuclear) [Paramecium tetraurelia strain d4-2]